jgi:hypothetical protein
MSSPSGPDAPAPLAAPPATTAVPLLFTPSDSVVALLRRLGASLLLTTYQAQQLLVVRATVDGISLLVRTFVVPAAEQRSAGGCSAATRCRGPEWP